ncbi:MAG: hypothetical protein WC444_05025 [Candidatus Paceibacterota bacterium]
MEELYVNTERMKHRPDKPKSNLEFWKVWVPVIVTLVTVFGSLVGIYIQGNKSASKIEYIVSQINDAIIPRLEKALEGNNTEIKILRERVAVLEKMSEVRRSRVVPTTFGFGNPLDLPAPAVKTLSKPATEALKTSTKYDIPRLQHEQVE